MSQLLAEGLEIAPAVAIDNFRQMSRIHEVDKAIQKGLSSGTFQLTYWPMTGQEAIPAVISQLTDAQDYMVTTCRGIHDQVAKGVPLAGLFAEALARVDGVNKGTLKAPAARVGAAFAPIAYSREIENNQIPHGESIALRIRRIVAG
jgi:2-oxoisovalerate dehydrogenase E1 component